LAPARRQSFVDELSGKRADLQAQIQELGLERKSYIAKKVEEAGGLEESLDQKLYDAIKDQASVAGLEYESGPSY
jgi:hypothetical protein